MHPCPIDLQPRRRKYHRPSRNVIHHRGRLQGVVLFGTVQRPLEALLLPPQNHANTTRGSSSPGKFKAISVFKLFYHCDCGDVPRATDDCRPHWICKKVADSFYAVSVEGLTQKQFCGHSPRVSDYVVEVLEMLKYGVYIDRISQNPAYRVSTQSSTWI